jgi:hypothetical protein
VMVRSVDLVTSPNAISRSRCLQGIFFTLIVGMFAIGAHARGRKNTTYDGVVDFGAQLLHLDDGCLSVDGTVASGSFFKDLKRIDFGGQPEYRRGDSVVTVYPESLTTSIRIVADQCTAALSNSPLSAFNGDSYSLTFEVEWKDGMHLRPAALSPAVARCLASRVMTDPRKDSTFPAIMCQMTVDSKGVPLDNHLIVSVFSSDGTRLTRLSAAP